MGTVGAAGLLIRLSAVRAPGRALQECFNKEEFDVTSIFFSRFQSVLVQNPTEQQLIPASFEKTESAESSYDYEPDQDEILEELLAIGRQVGMQEAQITSCLQNKKKSLNLIDAYLKNSKLDQITSTPSVIVGGELVAYDSFDDLKLKIDKILN